MDAREKFGKTLAKKLMGLTGISTVVIERPDDDEEAIYRNGTLAEIIGLGMAMGLEESFIHCVARGDADWDCGEFIWTPPEPSSSPVPGSELRVLGEYLERRYFLIEPSAEASVKQQPLNLS
jgi:hypothetical protein